MSDIHRLFPELHTERLDLIAMTNEHIPDIFKLFTDDRVTKYYNVIPLHTHEDAEGILKMLDKRYAQETGIRWGIALKGQRQLIGNIGFNTYTKGHRSTIGYSLMPDYWNKGYMSEAITEIITYGFDMLSVNRIEAEVIPGNSASERVLSKLGFRQEGLLRQWMLWDGKLNDINMYALLRSDRQ